MTSVLTFRAQGGFFDDVTFEGPFGSDCEFAIKKKVDMGELHYGFRSEGYVDLYDTLWTKISVTVSRQGQRICQASGEFFSFWRKPLL